VIADTPDGVVIDIKVIPRAGKTAIAGTRDNALLVRLAAPPVEGAANESLIELLARTFQLPKRQIAIIAGDKSRTKKVKIRGATADRIRTQLRAIERQ
jgi:uncharacterized protein (TIGR00251 family)